MSKNKDELYNELYNDLYNKLYNKLYNNISKKIINSDLDNESNKNAYNNLKKVIKNELKNELKTEIKNDLKSEFKSKIKKEIKNEIKNELKNESNNNNNTSDAIELLTNILNEVINKQTNEKINTITTKDIVHNKLKTSIENLTNVVENMDIEKKNEIQIYVDGSYQKEKKKYGCGIVIIRNNTEIECKYYNKEHNTQYGSVAAELDAAKYAMEYCLNNNIKTLNLCYDFAGIKNYCDINTKLKHDFTKEYRKFYISEIKNKVNINFIKIKAHTGDIYNNLADKLAKQSLK